MLTLISPKKYAQCCWWHKTKKLHINMPLRPMLCQIFLHKLPSPKRDIFIIDWNIDFFTYKRYITCVILFGFIFRESKWYSVIKEHIWLIWICFLSYSGMYLNGWLTLSSVKCSHVGILFQFWCSSFLSYCSSQPCSHWKVLNFILFDFTFILLSILFSCLI
jgi:hypothetical protein